MANPKRRKILDAGTPLLDLIPQVKPLDGSAGTEVAQRRGVEDEDEPTPEPPSEGRFTPPVNWVSDTQDDA